MRNFCGSHNINRSTDGNLQHRRRGLFPSYRFVILIFTQMFMMLLPGAMFQTLNFGMSCMLNRTITVGNSTSSSHAQCQNTNAATSSVSTVSASQSDVYSGGSFDWDKTIQSNLLAAYSYGGLIMVYFSGLLCDKLGTKPVMVISTGLATLSVLLTPMAAEFGGWIPVFIARLFLGLACGSGWPVAAAVASQWSGPKESSLFLSLASTGIGLGICLFNAVNGYICTTFGWQWIFYTSGIIGIFYFILLSIFFSSEPMGSRWISDNEKQYLTTGGGSFSNHQKRPATPWKSLLTSLPVVATIISGFSQFMIQGFVGIMLPTYFSEAFGVNPERVGLYSAVVNLAQVVGRFGSGFIAEYVKPFGNHRETWNTKFYNTASYSMVMVCLLCTTLFSCAQDGLVLGFMIAQFGINGLIMAGYLRTAILLAPRFVGQIMGLSNFGAYAACIILPYLASVLTPNGTIDEWKHAIYFVIGAVAFGTISFLLIGSAEEQEWAKAVDDANNTTTSDGDGLKVTEHDYLGLAFVMDAAYTGTDPSRDRQ